MMVFSLPCILHFIVSKYVQYCSLYQEQPNDFCGSIYVEPWAACSLLKELWSVNLCMYACFLFIPDALKKCWFLCFYFSFVQKWKSFCTQLLILKKWNGGPSFFFFNHVKLTRILPVPSSRLNINKHDWTEFYFPSFCFSFLQFHWWSFETGFFKNSVKLTIILPVSLLNTNKKNGKTIGIFF